MSKTIATVNAPAAIGPYVQGVDLGSMIITSGQIPVDPKTGSVPEPAAAAVLSFVTRQSARPLVPMGIDMRNTLLESFVRGARTILPQFPGKIQRRSAAL